jgi:polar amino acid transport system substrate-binding protein
MSTPRLLATLVLVAVALVAAGCSEKNDDSSSSASAQKTAAPDACAKDQLKLKQAGQLTVGTDKPAYPPYFTDSDPSNGKGFESAVAYAIAKKLGFDQSEVKWITVPFNASFAPGAKKFDFDVNEISITDKRKRAVDFSSPYYEAPQAVIAPKGSKAAGASSLADLKDVQIGVQIGTTSLDAVTNTIAPSKQPKVFNDSNDVVTALKQNQVDAVVTDLPTALYITAAQVPSAKVVGQFAAPGGDTWGALLEKGSGLTACVSKAVDALKADGTLKQLETKWMSKAAGAPQLQ